MDSRRAQSGENSRVAMELISCASKGQFKKIFKVCILCVSLGFLKPTFAEFCSHLLTQDFSSAILSSKLLEISSYIQSISTSHYTKLLLQPATVTKYIAWLLIHIKHATITDTSYWLYSVYYVPGNMLSTYAHQFIYFSEKHYVVG